MSTVKIWHNPRCSKSRDSLKYLQEQKKEFEVVEYLKEIPSKEEIQNLLVKLGLNAKDIIRNGEAVYKELNLKNENNEGRLIEAMIENPKLIQRPIVVQENKAVIGRPIENVVELLRN